MTWPHRAPCGARCAAGGSVSLGAGPEVHTGPRSCERCASGRLEVLGDAALVDEGGLVEALETTEEMV